jgi:hypothetical protein
MKNRIFINSLMLIFLMGVSFALAEEKKEKSKGEFYSGVVIGTGGAIGGRSMNLDIRINEHTSDEDIVGYVNLLKEKGQNQLRLELEKMNVGKISPSGRVGTDIAIARVFDGPDGKVIRLVTARQMPFLELYHGGRSTDYPFSIVEIRLDQDGKGAGSIIGGAKIKFTDEGRVEIESYGNQYAKLTNVRAWD